MELPKLTVSQRTLLEIVAAVRGMLLAGGMPGVQRFNLLQQIPSFAGGYHGIRRQNVS